MNAATSLELAVAVVANICCSMCSRTGNACALSERGGLVNLWVHTYAPHICCRMCSRSGNACTMSGGRFDTLSAHKSTEGLGMPANSQEGRFRVLRFRDFATLQVPTSSAPIHSLFDAPCPPACLPPPPPPHLRHHRHQRAALLLVTELVFAGENAQRVEPTVNTAVLLWMYMGKGEG